MSLNNKYGTRVLASNINITNDTRVSGCNNNDLIIGSSGCGKTGGYVIPNIQNITGSMIISDTKGQLERRFKKELINKGYDVYTIDLVNMSNSWSFNPMQYIRQYDDGTYYEKDILSLAKLLTPSMSHNDPFWDKAATSYIAFLLSYCLEAEPEENHTLIHVANLHRSYSQDLGELSFAYWVENHKDSYAAKKYFEFLSVKSAEKTLSSIFAFANVFLEPFSFKESQSLFGRENAFDLKVLGRKKSVLFLNVSDTDRAFDNIANILYSQALQVLCQEADSKPNGRLDVPVRIIMDDYAAGSTIPDFDKVISVIRSRDISVSLILQSLSQLESLYNKSASLTIINNCDHILYMGSQDLNTANFISSRAYKTPETILTMPRDTMCLLTAGEKAIFTKKIAPYSTLKQSAQLDANNLDTENNNYNKEAI